VERLLAETTEGADALPLLALTLERLYQDFGADGDLTVPEYEARQAGQLRGGSSPDDALGRPWPMLPTRRPKASKTTGRQPS
jgi:hypothetical protein